MKKIAVIGAGITGITTAYQLMKKGYDVTVFDKQKYAAMETSYANGGQLSACNGEVWTNWKTIYQGIQWIFKKDAPLSINLKPSLHNQYFYRQRQPYIFQNSFLHTKASRNYQK